ncbi:MAG: cyclic lactone autoinducer peptide [Coprococcus sp.]
MQMKKRGLERAKKTVVKLAKRTASVEANTACLCLNYQPKETESVKQLRKF